MSVQASAKHIIFVKENICHHEKQCKCFMCVFNIPPISKVIWGWGHSLKSHLIEPITPGLQGERFIHYTTVAPKLV